MFGKSPSIFTENSDLRGEKIKLSIKKNKIQSIISEGKSFLKTVSEKKDTLHLFCGVLSIFFDDSVRIERVFGRESVKGEVKR